MDTRYYGIFPNGQYIEKLTLDEINDTIDIEYILRCTKIDSSFNNPRTFTLITKDRLKNNLKIGDFELVDIGEDSGTRKVITIKDLRTKTIFQTETHIAGVEFFKEELIPLLNTLHEIGSWKMYQKLEELEALRFKNEQLRKELNELQQNLTNLDSKT